VTLVPPLLALADAVDADGRDLITAYAAGFEVECAVAEPISPAHYEAGWHATATFGTFGAAAAAAHLLDLNAEEIGRALNVAASMPSGTKQNFGSMTKPLHAGLCSRSGVTAATLVADGLTAGKTAISGKQGFWDLYDPSDGSFDDFEQMEFSIGDEWLLETEGIHMKAYPCCYFTHTAIAATQGLLDSGVDPDVVERIEVQAAGGAGDALTNPEPETGLEAKFSMEHAVACAVARDRVGLGEFEDDATDDPELAELRELVEFEVDESLPYDSHEATVRIVTDTEAFQRRQENPPGVHEDPLSESDFRAKFEACAERAVSSDDAAELYETLSALPEIEDIAAALRTA
jgi:2-methylcitrate dehydratase PrpD